MAALAREGLRGRGSALVALDLPFGRPLTLVCLRAWAGNAS
jgi:hypothetical protein